LGTKHLAVGKHANEDGGKETIFAEQKQALLMQGMYLALDVLAYDLGLDQ
jgi:hypothetical protein